MFKKSFSGNRYQRFHRSSTNHDHGGRGQRFARNSHKPSIHAARYVNKAVTNSAPVNIPIRHQFDDFAIDPQLKQNIITRGYTTPTPIQDQAIQPILEGRDVVGIANTGTGKTAAFLIPLINKIIHNRGEKILVIVPTRELAVQIDDEVKAFASRLNIRCVLCIGGASINLQIFALRQNPSIIISTPGRLKDLIMRRMLNLNNFRNIVLDEVDRMVDIGFINDIRYIVSLLPKVRQSLFFSATVSQEVNSIIQSFLINPVTISVKVAETADGIDQDIIRVKDKTEKIQKLTAMLRLQEFTKVLIFGRTKWGVERLSKELQQKGFATASIHGNKSQSQRLSALNQFKNNQLKVLVATDVAARGLDIEDVSHVINFDEPSTFTDYIHRIGRTGRANKTGKALTFVM
jgi:ATP-dependent RNA helicase RhlE